MFKHAHCHILFLLLAMTTHLNRIVAQEILGSKIQEINLSGDDIVEIE